MYWTIAKNSLKIPALQQVQLQDDDELQRLKYFDNNLVAYV